MFTGVHVLKASALRLGIGWFSAQESILLYQRTKAWSRAIRSGNSQKPVTPAPRYQRPLLASVGMCARAYTHSERDRHLNLKINKSLTASALLRI